MNSSNFLPGSRRAFLRCAGIAAAVATAPLLVRRPVGFADDRANRAVDIRITDHDARTHRSELNTAAIQAAIDACHAAGGGTVRVPQGRFRTGALLLKSNVHLHLEAGAILQGSRDWQDYRAFVDWSDGRRQWGDGDWSNALIPALNATNIRIDGPGAIDGVDCTRPQGEEGFRGPHAVLLCHCADIQIRDVTIRHAQALYLYDFERGGWMQGQPARHLHFKNIQATNLVRTTRVLGDAARQFRLTLENVDLALHDAHLDQPVLDINQFDALTLRDVRLANSGRHPVLTATRGNRVRIDGLVSKPDNPEASAFDAVDHIEND